MEITQIAFFTAVMFFVLALILALAWVARRYLGGSRTPRPKGSPLRRRERRLAMVEATSISPRHKLVLVRRDNVEHLLLLGGGNELVVESRIPTPGPDAESGLRDQEPQFDRSAAPARGLGSPAPGPELTSAAAPTFPPTTYGAATASNYEPSLYRREAEGDVGFSEEAPDFNRPNTEPDYFASAHGDQTAGDRPPYLDNDDPNKPQETSVYEKYRPTYGSVSTPNPDTEAGQGDHEPGGPADAEDGDDTKQAHVLSRFLRKDTTE
ncbi:Flagellar biosynthesis protein FliO / Domain of unknown function RL2641.C [hydrothermal vent metagenome]|uniref:Flagellar biosynthesis protein FliO n=1 Tax=hydrothermal vent metagenome TaxID=652676 RepID=A0A3B0SY21_9ZZZZ